MKDIENYTNKPLSEFNQDDTLYVIKSKGEYTYTFLVKYLSFSKGMIEGEILDIQPNNLVSLYIGDVLHMIGSPIKGRISKCYTYKKIGGAKRFKKDGKEYRCA